MPPPNVIVKYIEKPDVKLADEAADLFLSLMAEDTAVAVFSAGRKEIQPLMARAMMRGAALVPGVADMFAAMDENGRLVGFTLFTPPGKQHLTTEEQLKWGYHDWMAAMPEEGIIFFENEVMTVYPQFVDKCLGIEHGMLNTYWCDFNFVSSEYQKQGICRAMFDLAYEKARKVGAPICALTTTNEKNLVIYEKLGFTNRGRTMIPSQWGDCEIWTFEREVPSA